MNIFILSSLVSDEIAVYKMVGHHFFPLYILEGLILSLLASRISDVHLIFVPLLHASEWLWNISTFFS